MKQKRLLMFSIFFITLMLVSLYFNAPTLWAGIGSVETRERLLQERNASKTQDSTSTSSTTSSTSTTSPSSSLETPSQEDIELIKMKEDLKRQQEYLEMERKIREEEELKKKEELKKQAELLEQKKLKMEENDQEKSLLREEKLRQREEELQKREDQLREEALRKREEELRKKEQQLREAELVKREEELAKREEELKKKKTRGSLDLGELLKTAEFHKAFSIAKMVSDFIDLLRIQYSEMVMMKLKKDGLGTAIDVKYIKGYVPIHATYINTIMTTLRQKRNFAVNFDFAQRSRWNLKFDQALQNDFEKEGWDYLMDQQETAFKEGRSLKDTQPFVQIDTINDKKVLKILSPVLASTAACIECHNKWEQQDEVKALRKIQGIQEGKTFSKNELMGVLSVTVPMESSNSN